MISVKDVSFAYKKSDYVLRDISLDIPDATFVILLGQSGSGKTTLLNIIAGLMAPTDGEVIYQGKSIYKMKPHELSDFRSRHIGFVFQNYFLENRFSALENVTIPLLLNKNGFRDKPYKVAEAALAKVGLENKKNRRPTELSGGECQRVSIARALANDPDIIIADEPTGNLDMVNGNNIIKILIEQTRLGKTVLMVTHNENYSKYADIIYRISDGVIQRNV